MFGQGSAARAYPSIVWCHVWLVGPLSALDGDGVRLTYEYLTLWQHDLDVG